MVTPKSPELEQQANEPLPTDEQQPGTNSVQHHPDPDAKPMPDAGARRKYEPSSPYTAGND